MSTRAPGSVSPRPEAGGQQQVARRQIADDAGLGVAGNLAEQPLAEGEAALAQGLLLPSPAATEGAGIDITEVQGGGTPAEHRHQGRKQALGEVGQGVGTLQRGADVGEAAAHPALPGRITAGGAVAVEGPGEVADLGLVVEVGDLHPQVAGGHLLGAGGQADEGLDQLPAHEDQGHRREQQQVEDQQAEGSAGGQGGLPGERVDVVSQALQQGGPQLLDGIELRGDDIAELQPGHHLGGPGELIVLGGIDDLRRQGEVAVVALLEALQAEAFLLVERRHAQRGEGRLAIEAHRQLCLEEAALGQIAGGGIQVQRAVGLVQAVQDVLKHARELGPVVLGLQTRVEVVQ